MTPAATAIDVYVRVTVEFQSSAGFDPGRYELERDFFEIRELFQSSAGFDPGRYTTPTRSAGWC